MEGTFEAAGSAIHARAGQGQSQARLSLKIKTVILNDRWMISIKMWVCDGEIFGFTEHILVFFSGCNNLKELPRLKVFDSTRRTDVPRQKMSSDRNFKKPNGSC